MNVWVLFFSMITHSTPCETIASDHIVGADLTKSLPVFLNKIPGDAVIGYSPVPGTRRIFQFAELERIGTRYGVSVSPDSEACFEWSLQTLTEDMVRTAIRASLQLPEARIDVLAIGADHVPAGRI